MITVKIDEDDLLDMLMNRVGYWTDDKDTLDLFEQYYDHMIGGGCFDGAELDIMSIVDNDYVNNTSIVTREEFEKEREEYITDEVNNRINELDTNDEDIDKEIESIKQELEDDTPTWDDLEIGEHNLEFLSGYYIEAKTDNSMLVS